MRKLLCICVLFATATARAEAAETPNYVAKLRAKYVKLPEVPLNTSIETAQFRTVDLSSSTVWALPPKTRSSRPYCAFRFRTPATVGRLVWAFRPKGWKYREWYIAPEAGPIETGFETFNPVKVPCADHPVLGKVGTEFIIQELAVANLKPNTGYLIWFRLAMDVDRSEVGHLRYYSAGPLIVSLNMMPPDEQPLIESRYFPKLYWPLHMSATQGNKPEIERSLKAGADIDARDSFGRPAVICAIVSRHWDIVRLLLEKGADPNGMFSSFTVLYGAAITESCPLDIVKLLLEKGAEVNPRDAAAPLRAASSAGRADVIGLLLGHGANVNSGVSDGSFTALMFASYSGHLECVKALVKAGADIHAKADSGETALSAAKEGGHTAIAEFLQSNATR